MGFDEFGGCVSRLRLENVKECIQLESHGEIACPVRRQDGVDGGS